MLSRCLPFAVFMAFIGSEEIIKFLPFHDRIGLSVPLNYYLYPAKTLVVAVLLLFFLRSYNELQFEDLLKPFPVILSVATGAVVFVLWIHMNWTISALQPTGYNPTLLQDAGLRSALSGIRLFGAVMVVPLMEEIFWRSFLIRYIVNSEFTKVPIGIFTWPSFLISSLLFGLEHSYVFAGIMAGILYNGLLYRTKSILLCVVSHATTNLLLGIYVLKTNSWHFW